MTPSEIFEQLQQRINGRPELVQDVGAVYQFEVAGPDGGTWAVDLKTAPGKVSAGSSDAADCVIRVEQDDFAGIMSGEVDPQTAFMMGRIKVAGNFMLATKLRALI